MGEPELLDPNVLPIPDSDFETHRLGMEYIMGLVLRGRLSLILGEDGVLTDQVVSKIMAMEEIQWYIRLFLSEYGQSVLLACQFLGQGNTFQAFKDVIDLFMCPYCCRYATKTPMNCLQGHPFCPYV